MSLRNDQQLVNAFWDGKNFSKKRQILDLSRIRIKKLLFRNFEAGYIPELTRGNLYIFPKKTKDYSSFTIIPK